MYTKKLKVLSLFDGIACCRQALERAGLTVAEYYASEINLRSIIITQHRYPDTIQVGDVRNLRGQDFLGVDLLSAGSPCQNFSMMGHKKGMITTTNIIVDSLENYMQLKAEGFEFEGQSYLLWEFVRLVREIRPKYFFLENVKMDPKWMAIITVALGVRPKHLNSSLVSGQNRDRLYWTNIPLSHIDDLGVMIWDVIPEATEAAGRRGRILPGDDEYTPYLTLRKDGKSNCIVTSPYMTGRYFTKDGEYKMITPEHAEALQTIEIGYTDVPGVPKTSRYEVLGNAWTVDMIVKFFENLKTERSLQGEIK